MSSIGNGDLNAHGMQLPLAVVRLEGARVAVQKQEDGTPLLEIGPFALVLQLPFDSPAAKKIGGLLIAGIEIPTLRPPG